MKIYEIAQQYAIIKDMDLDEEVLQNTLEALQGTLEEKADNITKIMKELELTAEAKKSEAKRLQESAQADLKKVERLKDYLHHNLSLAGVKKLNTGTFNISIMKGREAVKVDLEKLPSEYWITPDPVPISKTELKKIMKEQEINIDGVEIIRNPDTLQIK